ncbi:MAG: SpoIID/LytB domain-containing protein [Christensenellales bacterium]
MKKRAVFILLAILMVFSLMPSEAMAANDLTTIRVRLSLSSTTSRNVTVKGIYTIPGSTVSVASGTNTVSIVDGQLTLTTGGVTHNMGTTFKMRSAAPSSGANSIRVATTQGTFEYLGNMIFSIFEGNIRIINEMHIETYLKGVVPHEMSNSWPIEALKAQAISARTYAVRLVNSSPGAAYHIIDTPANQVYKGYNASYTKAIQAIHDTFAKVIRYNGSLAQTFYAASNGGFTDIPPNVWSAGSNLPYLVHKQDTFDALNPSSISLEQYTHVLPGANFETRLSTNAINYIKSLALKDVQAAGFDASVTTDFTINGFTSLQWVDTAGVAKNIGYVSPVKAAVNYRLKMAISVTGDKLEGEEQTPVKRTQTISLTDTIPSDQMVSRGLASSAAPSRLKIYVLARQSNGDWFMYQRRNGHGLGMSQRGAQHRANSGQTCEQILTFYYPGTTISTANIRAEGGSIDGGYIPTPVASNYVGVPNCNEWANVRSGPATTHPILGRILAGELYVVTAKNYNGTEFHQIIFNNQVGYVSNGLLNVTNDTVTVAP